MALSWTVTRPGSAIFSHGGGGYKDSQVNDPVVIVNPSDATQLLMFYMALASPPLTGDGTICRATAAVSAPTVWTEQGVVINEARSLRPNSAVVVGTTIYLYGTEYGASENYINQYTSTDAGLTWGSKTQCLTTGGQGRNDGGYIGNCSVIKEGSSWTMIYGGSTNSSGFNSFYRYATSSDGVTWTKAGSSLITCGADGASDHFGLEWFHVVKIGEDYVMCYEAALGVSPFESPGSTTTYSLNVAHSRSLTSGWIKSPLNPIYEKSGTVGAFDRYHVATGAFYQIGGSWYLFHCGGLDTGQQYWDMAVAPVTGSPTRSFIDPISASMSSSGQPIFGT